MKEYITKNMLICLVYRQIRICNMIKYSPKTGGIEFLYNDINIQ